MYKNHDFLEDTVSCYLESLQCICIFLSVAKSVTIFEISLLELGKKWEILFPSLDVFLWLAWYRVMYTEKRIRN